MLVNNPFRMDAKENVERAVYMSNRELQLQQQQQQQQQQMQMQAAEQDLWLKESEDEFLKDVHSQQQRRQHLQSQQAQTQVTATSTRQPVLKPKVASDMVPSARKRAIVNVPRASVDGRVLPVTEALVTTHPLSKTLTSPRPAFDPHAGMVSSHRFGTHDVEWNMELYQGINRFDPDMVSVRKDAFVPSKMALHGKL
jgi:hypothetical protein